MIKSWHPIEVLIVNAFTKSEWRIVEVISFMIELAKEDFLVEMKKYREIEKLNIEVFALKTNTFRLEGKLDNNEAHERYCYSLLLYIAILWR